MNSSKLVRRLAYSVAALTRKTLHQFLQAIQPARWPQQHIQMYVHMLEKGMPSFSRREKFSFGAALTLWPLFIVALLPSDSLIDRGSILCIAALPSEATASVLFFLLRRRSKDRLTFWSTIAAAVAGEAALAFLIAVVAIVAHG